jgi:hypothetical protein
MLVTNPAKTARKLRRKRKTVCDVADMARSFFERVLANDRPMN